MSLAGAAPFPEKIAGVTGDTVVSPFSDPLHFKERMKQYGQNRRMEDRAERDERMSSKVPERRVDQAAVQTNQLLWSFAVAVCLILAALLQWRTPRNALMEQDRAPAQIRLELTNDAISR
jgi:hypothetical protein